MRPLRPVFIGAPGDFLGKLGLAVGIGKPGTADGVLSSVMQQQLGGNAPLPNDNNPIIQGIVVHRATPPADLAITDISRSDTSVDITFNGTPGVDYLIDYSTSGADGEREEIEDSATGGAVYQDTLLDRLANPTGL